MKIYSILEIAAIAIGATLGAVIFLPLAFAKFHPMWAIVLIGTAGTVWALA